MTNWREIVERLRGEEAQMRDSADRNDDPKRGGILIPGQPLPVGEYVGVVLALAEAEKMAGVATKKWIDGVAASLPDDPHVVPGEPLGSQVDRLATFIMTHINGEPSRNEGAIDCAIRLLRDTPTNICADKVRDAEYRRETEKIRSLTPPQNICADCATEETPEDWRSMKMFNEQRWRICGICERVQINVSGKKGNWHWLDDLPIHELYRPDIGPKCGTRKDGE